MKRKIFATTGSRSEYGILRPLFKAIKDSKKLQLILVVTGSHLSKKHGLTINEIKKDGFKIAAKVKMTPLHDSLYYSSLSHGKGIIEFSKLLKKFSPDINLILGDRDEMLASAIAAYHMNIPNAHVHGGDKSKGGIDEYNRHMITKISNIHFAATKKSKERIIKLGEDPKYVYLSGSPSVDEVIRHNISSKQYLEKKYCLKLKGDEIFFVQHSVTTQPELSGKEVNNTLKAIKEFKKTTIAISPNSDAGNSKIFENLQKYSKNNKFIHWHRSIPRSDFLGFLKNCGVLVGNSSSGMIEASYFLIPVVNIGIRQMGRERGKNVIDVPSGKTKLIKKAILTALERKRKHRLKKDYTYGHGDASLKIVRHLEKIKLNKQLIQKQIFY